MSNYIEEPKSIEEAVVQPLSSPPTADAIRAEKLKTFRLALCYSGLLVGFVGHLINLVEIDRIAASFDGDHSAFCYYKRIAEGYERMGFHAMSTAPPTMCIGGLLIFAMGAVPMLIRMRGYTLVYNFGIFVSCAMTVIVGLVPYAFIFTRSVEGFLVPGGVAGTEIDYCGDKYPIGLDGYVHYPVWSTNPAGVICITGLSAASILGARIFPNSPIAIRVIHKLAMTVALVLCLWSFRQAAVGLLTSRSAREGIKFLISGISIGAIAAASAVFFERRSRPTQTNSLRL